MAWNGPVFPTLPLVTFPAKRGIIWDWVDQIALSGKRTRYSLYSYPRYSWELPISGLRTAAAYAEFQTLVGFINSLSGGVGLFGYTDPIDNSVTAQNFGTGNGTTTQFQLVRSLGGEAEPVFLLNGNPTIYVAGVPKVLGIDYNISTTGQISFLYAPALNAALTWTGSYYWPCRLAEATTDFGLFVYNIYELKSLKFSSEKLDIVNVAAPPWYAPYEIGGVAPSFFADFTTEGGLNNYLASGTSYAGYAAWLTALGGSFTRSTTKMCTNAAGVLASVGVNSLAIDHNPTTLAPLGALIENASTNLLEYSQDYSQATWTKDTCTQTADSTTAPDGNTTGTLITNGAASSQQNVLQSVSGLSSATNYALSAYVKVDSGTQWFVLSLADSGFTHYAEAWFDCVNGVVGTTSVSAGSSATNLSITGLLNGWYRISVVISLTTTPQPFYVSTAAGNGSASPAATNSTWYIWGAQLEQLPFTSSYIPTTSATVTRGADNFYFPWSPFNATTTLFCVFDSAGIDPSGGEGVPFIVEATNNYCEFAFTSVVNAAAYNSNINVCSIVNPAFVAGTKYSVAARFANANYALSVNGGIYTTNSGTNGNAPTSMTNAYVGSNGGVSYSTYGHIYQIGYWPVAATNAQLQSLT